MGCAGKNLEWFLDFGVYFCAYHEAKYLCDGRPDLFIWLEYYLDEFVCDGCNLKLSNEQKGAQVSWWTCDECLKSKYYSTFDICNMVSGVFYL